jgi:asparagine synthase (glutamine-hydrolysing)
MCGIAGIYRFRSGRPVEERELWRMGDLLAHRGPDDRGILKEGALGLAHRRLSIIDTATRSRQPMTNVEEDAVIVYNGEVYNYVELREELEAEGYAFKTLSDTEVIIQLYRRWGHGCLERMNGMFAFALWDRRGRSLFIARDRLGIKPLYYHLDADGLIFASEVKSILSVEGVPARPHLEMLDSFMSVGYTPTEHTLFEGIDKLQPGHFLVVKDGAVSTRRYWAFDVDRERDRGERYYLERAEAIITDAVRLRLRSDVPLGVFLSGGIDSSAVVAMMHQMGIRQIKSFSVAWDYGSAYDETRYARIVSRKFGTDHHEHFTTPLEFMETIDDYIWFMDEPVMQAAALSLYQIARVARQHVTVILSGEGADEVFAGYPIYIYMEVLERYRALPRLLRRFLLNPVLNHTLRPARKYTGLSTLPIERRYLGVSFMDMEIKRALYSPEMEATAARSDIYDVIAPYFGSATSTDIQAKMQLLDINTWLVDALLIKADRMSMAASLELRVPFLDHRLVEFGGTLPRIYRYKRLRTKYLLKKLMAPHLGREIVYRKKMGFPTPLQIMFSGDLQPYVREVLCSKRFRERGYFRPGVVDDIVEGRGGIGEKIRHQVLWQLVVLEQWHRRFIDGPRPGNA